MSDKIARIKQEFINVYGNKCWMLYELSNKNRITIHHCIPKRIVLINEWWNLALLSNNAHQYFNYIEKIAPNIAHELNGLFYDLNRTYAPPTEDYYEEVNKVLVRTRKIVR